VTVGKARVNNEWTYYTNCEIRRQVCEESGVPLEECQKKFEECKEMSITDATPAEWDKVSKTFTGKLHHPQDNHDPVGAPDHYNRGAIEAIEAIKASMHPQEYKGYLKGNCLKYLWRYEYKNGLEDLKKAKVYLDWLIKEVAS
jgi:hypothetical protein